MEGGTWGTHERFRMALTDSGRPLSSSNSWEAARGIRSKQQDIDAFLEVLAAARRSLRGLSFRASLDLVICLM